MPDRSIAEPYIVRRGTNIVEAWSQERLTFEPKGWLVGFRATLRVAVQALASDDAHVLHAVYGSRALDLCDAENILFYNVGPGYFRKATQRGVRFERSYSVPDPPSPQLFAYPHYHRYALVPAEQGGFTEGMHGQVWTRWSDVPMPHLGETTKVQSIWYRMRTSYIDIVHRPRVAPDAFGINIDLHVPVGTQPNVSAALKPLLDGVVAAFHAHDGQGLGEVGDRLSPVLQVDASDIADLLCREDVAILGTRRLLWPWGQSVQWNPGDDRCAAAQVMVRHHTAADVRISGALFAVAPRE